MVKMQWSTIDQIPVTKENIDKVLEFLPYFEDKANDFFEFICKREDKPGIYHFPYYRPTSKILDFIYALKMENFLLPYDWDNDMPRILGLINGKRSISEASLSDLRKIFITLSVGEKFCDGYLANAVNSGIVLDVLKRLEEIRREI
ncbi:MAG TPA: DUF6508 domain-containing protein [Methanofastidiosum sp.]|nr:DUF6508 domain-containing protein [Methanofastidiosum sp.]